jgi:hypothetical protein
VTGILLTLEPRHFLPDGEIRVKCRGTIAAEFWEDDVENVFGNGGYSSGSDANKDKMVKVLEVQESMWPSM